MGKTTPAKIQPLCAADARRRWVKVYHGRHGEQARRRCGIHGGGKVVIKTGTGGVDEDNAAKNRRQDRRKYISADKRGTVPANLRGD